MGLLPSCAARSQWTTGATIGGVNLDRRPSCVVPFDVSGISAVARCAVPVTPSMAQAVPGTLKKTPLNARHRAHGARMVDFGGWDMPVEYTGVADEHMAV